MAPQLAHTIRKAIVVIAVATAAAAGGLMTAAPANAAVGANPYLNLVSSNTSCNLDTNRISFGAAIQLNSSLMNGAKVSFNFAFYQVDVGGVRTSPIYYHNGQSVTTNPSNGWSTPVFMDTVDPRGVNNLTAYTGGGAHWSGRLQTQINVAVLVGNRWYYTGWLYVNTHTSYYYNSLWQDQITTTDCLLDW